MPSPLKDPEGPAKHDDIEALSLFRNHVCESDEEFHPNQSEVSEVSPREFHDARKMVASQKQEEDEAKINRMLDARLKEFDTGPHYAKAANFIKPLEIDPQREGVLLAIASRMKRPENKRRT